MSKSNSEVQGELMLQGDSVMEARELVAEASGTYPAGGGVAIQPMADLRHGVMSLPVEKQNQMLAEFKDRRDNFRNWLMSQLVEGVHFAFTPGCEPKMQMMKDSRGETVPHYGVWNKKKNNGAGAYDWHPEWQWKPKPGLLAAGADFICDLLGLRDEYESDVIAWQQMGSKPGVSVQKCRLISRATGEVMGESLGAYKNEYDQNNAIKMAAKCAKCGAIINGYGLRDLFTQDGPTKDPNENPSSNPNAPKSTPRSERQLAVTVDELRTLRETYIAKNAFEPNDGRMKFAKWAVQIHGDHFKALDAGAWTRDTYKNCLAALEEI